MAVEKSESIGALAAALAKAQAQMTVAVKGSANPFFKSKYADLASIMEAVRKPLTDNEIAVVQTTDIDERGVVVETVLMHSSGEWISGRLLMVPVKTDPQGIGSAITYGRRYGLQSMVSLPSDDDDGNAASGQVAEKPRPALQHAPERPAAKAVVPLAGDASTAVGTTGLVDNVTVDTIKSLGTRLGYELDALVTKIAADYDGKGIRGLTKPEASGLLDRLQVAVDSKQARGVSA